MCQKGAGWGSMPKPVQPHTCCLSHGSWNLQGASSLTHRSLPACTHSSHLCWVTACLTLRTCAVSSLAHRTQLNGYLMTEYVPQGPRGVRKLRTNHRGTDALSEVKDRAIDVNNDNSVYFRHEGNIFGHGRVLLLMTKLGLAAVNEGRRHGVDLLGERPHLPPVSSVTVETFLSSSNSTSEGLEGGDGSG